MTSDQALPANSVAVEILGLVGFPARIVGRFPLLARFLGSSIYNPWPERDYAEARYGPRYRWRFWLVLDVKDLKKAEDLLNHGNDSDLMAFQQAQLRVFQMIAIIVSPFFLSSYSSRIGVLIEI